MLVGKKIECILADFLFRFFNAMAGNTWLVNATDYGHCDALEQSVIDIIQEHILLSNFFLVQLKVKWQKVKNFEFK